MDYLAELKNLANSRGIEITIKPNGHVQIHGKLLVNYYPLSKKKTAYIASTRKGVHNTTPKEAIRMSMKPPKCTKTPAKRKKTKSIKQKLFAKSHFCHWCQKELTMETATIDHVIPLKRGGLDHQMNMVLACEPCNQERGHSMPELKLVKG